MAIRTTSAGNLPLAATGPARHLPRHGGRCRQGFTLLEIMIVVSIIAILVTASIPYLYDSFANAAGDRAADAITLKAQEIRNKAIASGENQKILLTTNGITDVPLPSGWRLQIKGLNDSKFHDPAHDQAWIISSSGICEPLEFQLSDNQRQITLSFDALTAQPLQDEN